MAGLTSPFSRGISICSVNAFSGNTLRLWNGNPYHGVGRSERRRPDVFVSQAEVVTVVFTPPLRSSTCGLLLVNDRTGGSVFFVLIYHPILIFGQ